MDAEGNLIRVLQRRPQSFESHSTRRHAHLYGRRSLLQWPRVLPWRSTRRHSRISPCRCRQGDFRKIEGHVYVDPSLMPDGEHEGLIRRQGGGGGRGRSGRGGGGDVPPSWSNDNTIDLSAKRAKKKVGDPVALGRSPPAIYFLFSFSSAQ